MDKGGKSITFSSKIISVLERAWVFAKRDDNLEEEINLEIKGGKMLVKSKSDTGWFEESLSTEFDGKSIKVTIIPYLLMGILKSTKKAVVSGARLLFESKKEGWKYG